MTDNIHNYILYEKITSGGMAEIFLASDLRQKSFNLIVIKKLMNNLNSNNLYKEMFHKECQFSTLANHPNIVKGIDDGSTNPTPYLALEFIAGLTLKQVNNTFQRINKTIPLGLVLYITTEILNGLNYAHNLSIKNIQQGVVHRDISPRNIMIDYNGEIKIIDFGIIKDPESTLQTDMGVIKGKKGYMSPEQAQGLPIDFTSDLFSLGLVLIKVISGLSLTGYTPFELQKLKEDFFTYCSQNQIPILIFDKINKLVEENLALRYKSTADAQEDFNQILQNLFPKINKSFIELYLRKTFANHYQKTLEIVNFCRLKFENHTVNNNDDEITHFTKEYSELEKDKNQLITGLVPDSDFQAQAAEVYTNNQIISGNHINDKNQKNEPRKNQSVLTATPTESTPSKNSISLKRLSMNSLEVQQHKKNSGLDKSKTNSQNISFSTSYRKEKTHFDISLYTKIIFLLLIIFCLVYLIIKT